MLLKKTKNIKQTTFWRCFLTEDLYINRGRYVHASVCPRPCVAAKPRRVSACRGKPPCDVSPRAAKPRVRVSCDPPCGRAQLVEF